jgi:hypothetical protein
MPARTHTAQRTTATSADASATAPLRPAVVDPHPTIWDRETSATTTSGTTALRVTLSNRRLGDGDFGESHLVWRCLDCGETGSLTAFPTHCPGCWAGRESLAYWVED